MDRKIQSGTQLQPASRWGCVRLVGKNHARATRLDGEIGARLALPLTAKPPEDVAQIFDLQLSIRGKIDQTVAVGSLDRASIQKSRMNRQVFIVLSLILVSLLFAYWTRLGHTSPESHYLQASQLCLAVSAIMMRATRASREIERWVA